MDNKITKKRLKNFLTYDLLKTIIIFIIAAVIIILTFNIVETKPTNGQDFYLMVANNIYIDSGSGFENLPGDLKSGKKDYVFSYDILKVNYLSIQEAGAYSASYMLNLYMETDQNDIFICVDDRDLEDEESSSLFSTFIDYRGGIKIDEYILGAINYAERFYENGALDEDKVIKAFDRRYGKDSRFETDSKYEKGIRDEISRIENTYRYAKELKGVLENHQELYYNIGDEKYDGYAINLSKLGTDFQNAVKSTSKIDEETPYDVLLVVSNVEDKNEDLFYEGLACINQIIKDYTDYLG